MGHRVEVSGGEIAFSCAGDETILDAAERSGFAMPYSCRKGVCASCEGALIEGRVRLGRASREQQGPADAVKFCQARPCGDIVIDPVSITERAAPKRRRITARVYRIERPTGDVSVLHLRFPIGRRIPFMAGQYVKLLLDNGHSRNYSLANPPRDNDVAQLHVRHHAGGYFSENLLGRLKEGDELEVEMPFGLFTLSDNNEAPAILLATGTGFAPVRSMIQELLRQNVRRRIWLYWGARRAGDFYDFASPARWDARYSWFSFVPVLSQEMAGEGYREGYVQDAVLADHPDLSAFEVYACGNEAMIAAARDRLAGDGGLPAQNFHSDIFVPAEQEEPEAEDREISALG